MVPAGAVGGKTLEMVFLGHGRLVLQPPDVIEGGQLELFSGTAQLDEGFTSAVLVVGDNRAAAGILRRPGKPLAAAEARQAEDLFAQWRKKPERKRLRIEPAMLGNAVGDPSYQEYFAAWFHGETLGDLLYLVDPHAREQVSLGQFVPFEHLYKEKPEVLRQIRESIASQQRQGRQLGAELAELGLWDTWLSSSLRGRQGEPLPGVAAFEPERYTLDVTLAEPDLRLSGHARLDLSTVIGGSRAIDLELPSDFKIDKVTGEAGRPLFFLRSGEGVMVILPAAAAAGQKVSLTLDYSGNPVSSQRNVHSLYSAYTDSWYPRTGESDWARYDVTFHWPKKLDLLAGGSRLDGGEKADGTKWEHRSLATPGIGFSFEVGSFKIETARAGHVAIRVAFDPASHLDGGDRQNVTKTVADSLLYFEEMFGPYPADELNVVTVTRNFSQSLPGLVTLSNEMLTNIGGFWNQVYHIRDPRGVIAHEVAHQWWGDRIGWASYRDQWISEAMANYCSVLFAKNRLNSQVEGLTGETSGWHQMLARKAAGGRTLESVGPVVLGRRLTSSRASSAYVPVVYEKGAVVLGMLARTVGEKRFPQVLRQVAQDTAGTQISTEDLIARIERISGTDLHPLAAQLIYGTGLPEVFYSYRFAQRPDGGWRVDGQARQISSRRFRYQVVRGAGSSLEVKREAMAQLESQGLVLAVPVEIDVFDPTRKGAKTSPRGGNAEIQGTIQLHGETTDFSINVAREPKEFWLDKHAEVFTAFLDQSHHHQSALLFQGMEAAAAGHAAEAEELLAKAASTEEPPAPGDSWQDTKTNRRLLAARIDLCRARLYLEQGRDAEARAALDRADWLDNDRDWWSTPEYKVLAARLDLHGGAFEKAYRRLNHDLLEWHAYDSLEGYLLLAIAARATRHSEQLAKALEKARETGAATADLALLQQP
jgi:hypothetical protein